MKAGANCAGDVTLRAVHLRKPGSQMQMRGTASHQATEVERWWQAISATASTWQGHASPSMRCLHNTRAHPQCYQLSVTPAPLWPDNHRIGDPGSGEMRPCLLLTHHFSHRQDFWKHF